jgi:hypothetical protein
MNLELMRLIAAEGRLACRRGPTVRCATPAGNCRADGTRQMGSDDHPSRSRQRLE